MGAGARRQVKRQLGKRAAAAEAEGDPLEAAIALDGISTSALMDSTAFTRTAEAPPSAPAPAALAEHSHRPELLQAETVQLMRLKAGCRQSFSQRPGGRTR